MNNPKGYPHNRMNLRNKDNNIIENSYIEDQKCEELNVFFKSLDKGMWPKKVFSEEKFERNFEIKYECSREIMASRSYRSSSPKDYQNLRIAIKITAGNKKAYLSSHLKKNPAILLICLLDISIKILDCFDYKLNLLDLLKQINKIKNKDNNISRSVKFYEKVKNYYSDFFREDFEENNYCFFISKFLLYNIFFVEASKYKNSEIEKIEKEFLDEINFWLSSQKNNNKFYDNDEDNKELLNIRDEIKKFIGMNTKNKRTEKNNYLQTNNINIYNKNTPKKSIKINFGEKFNKKESNRNKIF